jgi:hypothetical protein
MEERTKQKEQELEQLRKQQELFFREQHMKEEARGNEKLRRLKERTENIQNYLEAKEKNKEAR